MVTLSLLAGVGLADIASRELLLFAGIWIAVGLVDELIIDVLWLYIRATGRGRALVFSSSRSRLRKDAAIFIPCWHEHTVIGLTLSRCRTVWFYPNARFYVGVYPNDPETLEAVQTAAETDPRVVIVVLPHPGPTTKADCLNYLYLKRRQEIELGETAPGCVVLHDAEDHVHADALELIDDRMQRTDFVQLPVHVEVHRG